jgi:hypothetical protein
MTSISAAKRLRTRVETYLAGVLHPFPEERVIAGTIQSFYGWFFPLLRNAVICGALQYFADASGSMTLQILAIIGLYRTRGVLLFVHQYVGADTVSFREAQATRILARWTGHAGRSVVVGVRDLGRNGVRHR